MKSTSLKLVTCKMPHGLVDQIDDLIRKKFFISRSDAIRTAMRDLIDKYKYRET